MTKHMVLGGDYEIETFCIRDLSEVEVSEIVKRIKDIHLSFSPSSNQEKIRNRLCKNPGSCIDVITQTESGECGGYSTYYTEDLGKLRVMFRNATIIGAKHRSRGLYKILLANSIVLGELDFVVTMTQNPRVYETLSSFSPQGIIYPAPGIDLPEVAQELASQFCKEPGLDRDTLIVRGVYERINKDPDFKKVRTSAVEHFFAESLGQSDGFFIIMPLR